MKKDIGDAMPIMSGCSSCAKKCQLRWSGPSGCNDYIQDENMHPINNNPEPVPYTKTLIDTIDEKIQEIEEYLDGAEEGPIRLLLRAHLEMLKYIKSERAKNVIQYLPRYPGLDK